MAVEEFFFRKTLTVMAVFLKEKPFPEGKSTLVIRTRVDPC
ncbi:hypothetical protein [Oribacterium sp. P6A1]|nr:hypothetical protein [Oribacterium sp. P6A1]